MKRIAPAVLSVLAVAALAAFAPAPKPIRNLGLAKVAATDSTVSYTATVSLKVALRPGDKLRFNWFQNSTLAGSLDTTAQTATQVFRAACGTSGTVYVNVKVVYADGTMSPTVKSNVASYTQAACPAPLPTIDSVRIDTTDKLSLLQLVPGQTVTVHATAYGN